MITRTYRSATILAAVIGIAALAGCSATGASSGTGDAPAADDSNSQTEAEAPETPGLNTPVATGSFEYTALSVQDAGTTVGDSILSETAQGTYIQVDLRVANTGDSPETFLINYVQVRDADGKTYDADSTATVYASDAQTWISAINPGNAIEGPILFDLPVGVTPVELLVSDNAFADGTPIRLG